MSQKLPVKNVNWIKNICKFGESFIKSFIKLKKVEKSVPNLHDKIEYVLHMRNLKQALNHGLVLKKLVISIKFNQETWFKS